nr:hypothetical protein [Tanacetum cinerariifolium]
MLQHGIKPDQVTFTSLISVCGSLAVHGWGKADSMVVSSLISMYSKCGFMDDANIVFEMTTKKDTVSWGMDRMVKESWKIFKSMKKEWNVNLTADHYSCMIDIIGRAGMLTEAYELDLDSRMCVLHSNIHAAK